MPEPDPSHIMQIGMGFFGSKALLSAVELGVFTALARKQMTASEMALALALHSRAVPDYPDALVALRLLDREGSGPDAVYRNTPDTALFLDRESPAYIGGILEMANARLFRFWGISRRASARVRPRTRRSIPARRSSPSSTPRLRASSSS